MGGFLPSGGVVCGDSAGISAFSVLVLGCSGGEKHGGNFFNGSASWISRIWTHDGYQKRDDAARIF